MSVIDFLYFAAAVLLVCGSYIVLIVAMVGDEEDE